MQKEKLASQGEAMDKPKENQAKKDKQVIKQQKTGQDKKKLCKLTEKTTLKKDPKRLPKSEDEEAADLL